jgi:hypothetical protein
MVASARGFETGTINIIQTLMAKLARGGQANVPYSRANLYA